MSIELNQTRRDTLPATGGLFGFDSTSDVGPRGYTALALRRASVAPSATVTLTAGAYTTVSSDIGRLLEVTSGATDATITLQDAAAAGAGTELMIRKADAGLGMVIILEGASTVAWLQAVNDLIWVKSTGAAWEIIQQISTTPLSGPSYVDGRYYPCCECLGAAAAVAAVDTIYLYPFMLREAIKIQRLGVRVGTGGAGSAVKSGIWRSSPTGSGAQVGRPYGAPVIVDNTGQSTATTSTDAFFVVSPSYWLPPGVYWAGSKYSATLPSVACVALQANGNRIADYIGAAAASTISTGNLRALSFGPDAFANNMPTFASNASFAEVASGNVPGLIFQAAV